MTDKLMISALKRKPRVWLVVALFFSSCSSQNDIYPLELAVGELADVWYRDTTPLVPVPSSEKQRVSVFPFTDFGDRKTGLSGFASDTVIEFLTRSGRFIMLAPSAIDEIRQGLELGATGSTDPSTTNRFGKLMLPDVMMFGRVGIVDDSGLLIITLIDPETGEVTLKEGIRFQATSGLRELARRDLDGMRSRPDPSASIVKAFLISNWAWLWAVLLVPPLVWMLRRRSKKTERSERKA